MSRWYNDDPYYVSPEEERVMEEKTEVEDDGGCEHDWVDAVEGPEVVGKVCATCGEPYDYSGEFDDNYC